GTLRHARLRRQHAAPQLGHGARGRRGERPALFRVPRALRRAALRAGAAMNFLAYGVAGWICLVGLYGAITSRNLIHLALCLTVTQSSTYILLLAIGYVNGGGAPIFKGVKLGTTAVDPVVQALTLTDVVVSVTVVALILALALDAHRLSGTVDPDRIADVSG